MPYSNNQSPRDKIYVNENFTKSKFDAKNVNKVKPKNLVGMCLQK